MTLRKANASSTGPASSGGRDEQRTMYCKLFSDMVTAHLCDLRRRELGGDEAFSCAGCYTEIDVLSLLLKSPKKRYDA